MPACRHLHHQHLQMSTRGDSRPDRYTVSVQDTFRHVRAETENVFAMSLWVLSPALRPCLHLCCDTHTPPHTHTHPPPPTHPHTCQQAHTHTLIRPHTHPRSHPPTQSPTQTVASGGVMYSPRRSCSARSNPELGCLQRRTRPAAGVAAGSYTPRLWQGCLAGAGPPSHLALVAPSAATWLPAGHQPAAPHC